MRVEVGGCNKLPELFVFAVVLWKPLGTLPRSVKAFVQCVSDEGGALLLSRRAFRVFGVRIAEFKHRIKETTSVSSGLAFARRSPRVPIRFPKTLRQIRAVVVAVQAVCNRERRPSGTTPTTSTSAPGIV